MNPSRATWLAIAVLTACVMIAGVIGYWHRSGIHQAGQPASVNQEQALAPAGFVGRATCAGCHAEQDRLWQGSHHDLAMQTANETTVLANFNNAQFRYNGIVSRFFRRDGRFMVNTDGPDGKLADFEILYTFGVAPLQQYLVALPGGRLQALSIAWDSRTEREGGQRWFHLYPDDHIDANDELHWTRLSQNWNYMCAECHSTDLHKNYDQSTHGYHTTWSEIDVSCEACHGPGSQHVAFTQKKPGFDRIDPATQGLTLRLDERRGVHWSIQQATGNATRSTPRTTQVEIDTCARCHARRGQWFPDYQFGQPLMNTHLPALLQPGLYHPDGQIDGEVYEYGSFLQSRMYQAGVTCSDCHEPHSLKLRAEGNGVCLQCHAAEKYAQKSHHFHSEGSTGSACLECHMPTKNYMVVHPRHDHSFRIPRPDLSVQTGVPNACNHCHTQQTPAWAAQQLRTWLGHDSTGFQAYAQSLHAARTHQTDAETQLISLLQNKDQPAIARATAAFELGHYLTPDSFPSLVQALYDPDPLVRGAALQSLDSVPAKQRWESSHQALQDPVRVVRALAAAALAGISTADLPSLDAHTGLPEATTLYLQSQQLNADEPGAQVNLGNLHAARGEDAEAEQSYREALAVNPDWIPAYANLGDLYRRTHRDAEALSLFKQALTRQPQSALLHHSYGLALVRQHQLTAALPELKKAMDLAPDDTHFTYVYAVALNSAGKPHQALAILRTALKRTPDDPELTELLKGLGG